MKIIIKELRKIFNLKMVGILLLGSLLIYKMFIDYYVETDVKFNRPNKDEYKLAGLMVERYGETLEENEFEDLKKLYNDHIKKIDEYLSSKEECIKFNIDNYERFSEKRSLMQDDEVSKLASNIFFNDGGELFWEAQAYESIIEKYNSIKTEEGTIKDTSIFPSTLDNNYKYFIQQIALLIILSLIFMLSPLFINDKMRDITYLQYSAKIGRKIYLKKIIAGLIASAIIVVAEMGILFGVYFSINKSNIFFNNKMTSFLGWSEYVIDVNYFQYLILTIGLVAVIAIIATLGSMYISNKAKNYVSIIVMQIPFAAVLIFVANQIHRFLDSYRPYHVVALIFVLMIISIILIITDFRKNKKINIYN